MKHKTFAQQLGFGRQAAKPAPPAAPKVPAAGAPPRANDGETGIDGLALSPLDYERRLRGLGLEPPGAEHRRIQPPRDPEAERFARRTLDRAERRTAAEQARAIEERTAEVNAGAIDGRTASPDHVRERLSAFGVETHGLAVHPVGRELAPTRDQRDGEGAHTQLAADREVARAINKAMQTGQSFDAKKLSPGELRALLELRGAGL